MAVASAGPYANHLHLAPDRKPRQYLTTQIVLEQKNKMLYKYARISVLRDGDVDNMKSLDLCTKKKNEMIQTICENALKPLVEMEKNQLPF